MGSLLLFFFTVIPFYSIKTKPEISFKIQILAEQLKWQQKDNRYIYHNYYTHIIIIIDLCVCETFLNAFFLA